MERNNGGRGEATRERLVTAALELFGRRGYEGVGAREIAASAGAPLSAIPYHFGTKDALYRAVLARVSANLGEALAPAAAAATQAAAGSPDEAKRGLLDFQAALIAVLTADPRAEGWAKILLREHLDPSAAFDLIYEDAGRGAVDLLAALIARASGRSPDQQEVIVEAFARMGEALVFRIVQAAVKRRLGWSTFGDQECAQIGAVVRRMHATC